MVKGCLALLNFANNRQQIMDINILVPVCVITDIIYCLTISPISRSIINDEFISIQCICTDNFNIDPLDVFLLYLEHCLIIVCLVYCY